MMFLNEVDRSGKKKAGNRSKQDAGWTACMPPVLKRSRHLDEATGGRKE
jgi:hypothetical protein